MVHLPMRSYFRYAIKKVWDLLRVWSDLHHMQFTGAQVMVQHLVRTPSTLLTMQIATLSHTHPLATTLFQVEYKAVQQSWLGLTTSHLLRWRCFIVAE